jgi:hypothetical protein
LDKRTYGIFALAAVSGGIVSACGAMGREIESCLGIRWYLFIEKVCNYFDKMSLAILFLANFSQTHLVTLFLIDKHKR